MANYKMYVIYHTDISLELLDIFFPMKNCIGIIITMQQADPRIALEPNFKYNK